MPKFSKRPARPWKGKGKAKVSTSTKRYVKRTLRARLPVRSITMTPSAGGEVTTTADLTDLTEIQKVSGSDDPETYRDEQQIKALKLFLTGVWAAKDTATVDNYMRVIVFTWREERSANPPSAAEIFGDAFSYNYLAKPFFDIDTTKGTVLWDKLYHLPPHYDGASQISGYKTIPIMKTIYLSKHPKVQYLSNAGTGGKNHIYLLVLGNSGTGTQTSTLQLKAQVHFQ